MRKRKKLLVLAMALAAAATAWFIWKYAHRNLSVGEVQAITVYVHDEHARGKIEEHPVRVTDEAIIREIVDAWNGRTRVLPPLIAGYYGFLTVECRDGSRVELCVRGTGRTIESPEGVFFETTRRGQHSLAEILGGQRDLGPGVGRPKATQPGTGPM